MSTHRPRARVHVCVRVHVSDDIGEIKESWRIYTESLCRIPNTISFGPKCSQYQAL